MYVNHNKQYKKIKFFDCYHCFQLAKFYLKNKQTRIVCLWLLIFTSRHPNRMSYRRMTDRPMPKTLTRLVIWNARIFNFESLNFLYFSKRTFNSTIFFYYLDWKNMKILNSYLVYLIMTLNKFYDVFRICIKYPIRWPTNLLCDFLVEFSLSFGHGEYNIHIIFFHQFVYL